MTGPIEIRMFGRLHVRRPDGSVVPDADWSAGKTTDLLRLLALDAGQRVRAEGLVDKLWPAAKPDAGRASLRTASSKIRTTIGVKCVTNHLGALTLVGVWVDTAEFTALVAEGLQAVRAGDDAAVVDAARRAEALYVDDFRAHADDQPWATQARYDLALLRQQLLTEAGDSALRLFWLRDAVEFARRAVGADASVERPHRTLMGAHAALGQTELALRAFEHCRASLADELGADPSEQTRALHLAILSGTPPTTPPVPFVARERELSELVTALEQLRASEGRSVICVVGAPGSGRHALVDAALRAAHAPNGNVDVMGPFDGTGATTAEALHQRLSDRDPLLPETIVVLVSAAVLDDLLALVAPSGSAVRVVGCPPLGRSELSDLATQVLRGRPSAALVDALEERSGMLAGLAVTTLRTWLADGRVFMTSGGLELWDGDGPSGSVVPTGPRFRELLDRLDGDELEMCELLSVVDRPVSAADIAAVTSDDRRVDSARQTVRAVLDHLVDRGVLEEDLEHQTYSFREPGTRHAFATWLRPSAHAHLSRLWNGTAPSGPPAVTMERRATDRPGVDRRQGQRGRRASDRV